VDILAYNFSGAKELAHLAASLEIEAFQGKKCCSLHPMGP